LNGPAVVERARIHSVKWTVDTAIFALVVVVSKAEQQQQQQQQRHVALRPVITAAIASIEFDDGFDDCGAGEI
jgi:hypothetical protein